MNELEKAKHAKVQRVDVSEVDCRKCFILIRRTSVLETGFRSSIRNQLASIFYMKKVGDSKWQVRRVL